MRKAFLFAAVLLSGLFFLGFSLASNAQRTVPSAYPNNIPINYVRTWELVAPENSAVNITIATALDKARITTRYLDGLGRPLQTVTKGITPLGKDLVSAIEYDETGREQFKYLPFAASSTDGNTHISDGLFKLNPFHQQAAFYNTLNTTSPIKGQGETYFYGQTFFEASPLNRILENFAPGDSWAGTSGQSLASNRRSVKAEYFINTALDSVRIWDVTSTVSTVPATSGSYQAGELYKNVSKDENSNAVVEYKDKEGKVVLKKVQLDSSPGSAHVGWLCTYYIYNDLGQLRFVLQPKAITLLQSASNWTITTSIRDELCFYYGYDSRGRMTTKKVPGAGEVYMVYDARDRLVMTQDPNLRSGTIKWIVTLYDELNRLVKTGLYTSSSDRAAHQSAADASPLNPYPFSPDSQPSSGFELLTQTGYDDYSSLPSGAPSAIIDNTNITSTNFFTTYNATPEYAQEITQSFQTKGMATWVAVKVLGTTNTFLYSVSLYDEKGRVIQLKSTNLSGGTDVATTQYDFSGRMLRSLMVHEKGGTNANSYQVLSKMAYDAGGRLLNIKKRVNNSTTSVTTDKTIVENTYDELGQLKSKKIGTTPFSSNPLETLTHDYNIRGWMLGANRGYAKATSTGTNWFGFDLGYDQTTIASLGSYVQGAYNGNITGTVWKSRGDNAVRKYDFTYDAVNRLSGADFNQYSSGFNRTAGLDFSVAYLSYDANGNILSMNQKGWKLGGSTSIDQMSYTYETASNKLKGIIDTANNYQSKLGDFKYDATTKTATDYGYDGNGNMLSDANKKIAGIVYNHLNLPQSIPVTGKGSIEYIYDAGGSKLKKIVHETGKDDKTTLYMFGTYEDDVLRFLPHEGGRIRVVPVPDPEAEIPNPCLPVIQGFDEDGDPIYSQCPPQAGSTIQSFVYDYFLKDHLGNVRMMLTEEQTIDEYPAATMESTYTATEEAMYSYVATTRFPVSGISGYPMDQFTDPNYKVAKLDGGGNKIGPAIMLKVMSGDKFNLRASSWYKLNSQSPASSSNPVTELISAIAGGTANITTVHGTSGAIVSSGALSGGVGDFFIQQANVTTSGRPKAYLNWILLDEHFKLVESSSGAEQVPDEADYNNGSTPNNNVYVHQRLDMPVDKNGYLYIYVSNETPNIDVFFDNLQVTHIRGSLLEETHYYPFGLTMQGISSKSAGSLINKNKFVGKELQSNEFSDGSGLELEDFGARFYDVQIGRWHTLDAKAEKYYSSTPYNYVDNNPITRVDIDGHDWVVTVSDTKASDGSIIRTVNVSIKVEVLNNSSNARFNTAGFASAMKIDLINTYSSMSGQSTTERIGETYSSSPTTMVPISNGNGKDVKVTYNVNVTADVSVITDISKKSKDSHLVEVVDDGTKGKLGDDGTAYGRAPFYGNQVYINESKAQGMVDDTDNNTLPHEFGHTAGFKHPDQQQWAFGLIKGSQYLDYSKNKNNVMFSNVGSYKLNDATSTQLTLKQLIILINNYQNGQLNKNTVSQY